MRILLLLVLVSLLSCKQDTSGPLVPRFNHVMLYVSDIEHTMDYYKKAFNVETHLQIDQIEVMQEDSSFRPFPVKMAFMKFPQQDFIYEVSEQSTLPDSVQSLFQHIGIDVQDIEIAYQQAIDNGATPTTGIRTVRAQGILAKNAFFSGPDGEAIELMEILEGSF